MGKKKKRFLLVEFKLTELNSSRLFEEKCNYLYKEGHPGPDEETKRNCDVRQGHSRNRGERERKRATKKER